MTFAEALRACFDKAFTFSGRASRAEYWWFVLFWLLSYVTLATVAGLSLPLWLGEAALTVFLIAMAAPLLAVSFRRLQDTGRTGWLSLAWVFGALVASGGRLFGSSEAVFTGVAMEIGISLTLLVWMAAPGMPGPNAFGPAPRGARG